MNVKEREARNSRPMLVTVLDRCDECEKLKHDVPKAHQLLADAYLRELPRMLLEADRAVRGADDLLKHPVVPRDYSATANRA